MANFNGQMQACGSGQQTYYKITVDFGHVNATNSAIQIDITNDVTSGVGCTWGFKESIILAKTCDPSCTECSGSAST
jgi:hypothetical protein